MTDYTELVKFLRGLSPWAFPDASNKRMQEAAAAIEDLQAEIRESMQKCAECGAEPITLEQAIDRLHELGWLQEHDRILSQPHWVSVAQPPKDKQECFVAYKGPLGFVYDTGRFYDDLNSGLDEDIFVEGTSGFVFGGEVGYALESMDYWMPIEPPQEVQDADR